MSNFFHVGGTSHPEFTKAYTLGSGRSRERTSSITKYYNDTAFAESCHLKQKQQMEQITTCRPVNLVCKAWSGPLWHFLGFPGSHGFRHQSLYAFHPAEVAPKEHGSIYYVTWSKKQIQQEKEDEKEVQRDFIYGPLLYCLGDWWYEGSWVALLLPRTGPLWGDKYPLW